MNKIQKYFQFSGTINGTNYFLRNVLSSIAGFAGGFLLGVGIAKGVDANFYLGIMLIFPALWFQFATIYKRINALYPDNVKFYTSAFIAFQFLSQIFKKEQLIGPAMTLGLLVVGVILIFSDSKIENHEG